MAWIPSPFSLKMGRIGEGSQAANSLESQARALYGDRWHQFTDELPGTAYFPIAVFKKVPDFTQGTVVTRFAIVGGDIDTEAGIMFNYQPNGDFMALRMDADESALKLYQWTQGQQNALRIIENVARPAARRRCWRNACGRLARWPKVPGRGPDRANFRPGRHLVQDRLRGRV
jgi:hypothetical protein